MDRCIYLTKVASRCSRNARQYGVCRQHWRSLGMGTSAAELASIKPWLEAQLRVDCTSLVLGYLEIGRGGLVRVIKYYLQLNERIKRTFPGPSRHSSDLVVALYGLIALEGEQLCQEQPEFHRVVLAKADELVPRLKNLDQKAAVLKTVQTIRNWHVPRLCSVDCSKDG